MFKEFTAFKAKYMQECQQCGTCFERCYAYQKTKYPIFQHLKDFFRGREPSWKIIKFLNACNYCKSHEVRCAHGLDLTELFPAIKFELYKRNPNYTWVPQHVPSFAVKLVRSPRFYYFLRYLNNSVIPHEFRAQYEANRKPQKREVVLFSGCGIQQLENQFYTLLDVFKKLKIDFGLIEGSYTLPVCCGAIHFEVGNFKYGKWVLRNLQQELNKFGTKKVVVYCATCYYGLKKLAPNLLEDFDFEIVHAAGYLAEILKKQPRELLQAPKGRNQLFTIHDSCHLAHSGETQGIRNLLSILPGASISEMKHTRKNALCDASYALQLLHNPLDFLVNPKPLPIIKEALETNADALCSLCPGCHTILTIFGADLDTLMGKKAPKMPVRNWVSILGAYLGIHRRDMLTYRFAHLITTPLKDSGIWYLWKVLKALVRGYFGKRSII